MHPIQDQKSERGKITITNRVTHNHRHQYNVVVLLYLHIFFLLTTLSLNFHSHSSSSSSSSSPSSWLFYSSVPTTTYCHALLLNNIARQKHRVLPSLTLATANVFPFSKDAASNLYNRPPSDQHQSWSNNYHYHHSSEQSLSLPSSSSSSFRCSVVCRHDSITAQRMIAQVLCPVKEENYRTIAAMELFHQQHDCSSTAGNDNDNNKDHAYEIITRHDPRTEYTYDEFPLDSFDRLIDRALLHVNFQSRRRRRRQQQQQHFPPLKTKKTRMEEVLNNNNNNNNHIPPAEEDDECNRDKITMVDIGSGCGRLVFYAALTRGYVCDCPPNSGDNGSGNRYVDKDDDVIINAREEYMTKNNVADRKDVLDGKYHVLSSSSSSSSEEEVAWDVHGVEIGKQLHSLALTSVQRGIDQGWFQRTTFSSSSSETSLHSTTATTNYYNLSHMNGNHFERNTATSSSLLNHMEFHNGNALVAKTSNPGTVTQDDAIQKDNIQSLLSQTDIIFAYSTAFEANADTPYDPELQAMLLSPKWSTSLSQFCTHGCVAITTDRVLNPKDGWKLLDRVEVTNPDVWGSVGYISFLDKRS